MQDDHPNIRITRAGQASQLLCRQWVPLPVADVFPFFSAAQNLERLTPEFLRFRMLRAPAEPLRAGAIIDYRLSLHHVPVWWRTQIRDWDPPRGFVDVQVRGPFRQWHHHHEFVSSESGTLILDTVEFDVYCRSLRATPLLSWIDSDLRRIFSYRRDRSAALLG